MRRTQYFKWGLTAFLTVCAVLIFYDTFYQAGTLQQFVSRLASILAPVLYGFAHKPAGCTHFLKISSIIRIHSIYDMAGIDDKIKIIAIFFIKVSECLPKMRLHAEFKSV